MSGLDIVALGEAMVEFNQTAPGARTYLQGFGGDTSNFAIAAARQGARVGCVGALGDDVYGRMLRALWREEGVDDSEVLADPAAFTAVYFVTHDADGHHFSFFRQGSAASRLGAESLPRAGIRSAQVLHYSGISLAISASARAACHAAVQAAREAGAKVCFDTNLRRQLWPLGDARNAIEAAIGTSDICLPSHDDLAAITGLDDPQAMLDHCLGLGAGIVALKLGAAGAWIADSGRRVRIAPHPCRPVDATGAGDTFGGAFVARLLAGDALEAAGRYAAVASALSTEGFGAVAPIPRAAQVRAAFAAPSVA
jgi:2-dehydro-3-deoxygluconokinase